MIKQACLWVISLPIAIYYSAEYELKAVFGALITTELIVLLYFTVSYFSVVLGGKEKLD